MKDQQEFASKETTKVNAKPSEKDTGISFEDSTTAEQNANDGDAQQRSLPKVFF